MSEWRQFSRLPESPDYWNGLQDRIARAALPIAVVRTRRDRWVDGALATSILAAAAVAGVLMMRMPAVTPTPSFQASLAPADPVALELLNSTKAPDISGLLTVYTPRPVQ